MPDSQQPDTELQQRAQEYLLRQRAQHYLGFQGNEPSGGAGAPFGAAGPMAGQFDMTKHQQDVAGVQGAAMAIGSIAGGVGGRVLGGLPGAVAGEGAGTFLGGLLSGTPPGQAAQAGVVAGGAGGLVEGGLNLATRSLASMGGVQGPAVSEALSRGTGAKTMFIKPAQTAEAELGSKIAQSAEPRNVGITPGRLTTEKQLGEQQAAGRMVDLTPTLDALNKHIESLQAGGVGSDARTALGRLTRIRTDISNKYLGQGTITSGVPPKIAVTPEQADFINQQLQDSIGNAYGRAGAKEAVRALKDVAAKHTASFRAQTGTQQSAASTGKRLNDIEALRGQISEKSPETFVRSVSDAIMTHGESGDQSALIALRNFDPSGKVEAQIKSLGARREWTSSQSRIAHNIKWEFVRRLPRFLAKLTGVARIPAGQSAAAIAAFVQAMEPRNNP